MTRRILTDELWSKLLAVMLSKGCYDAKNSREVMEAILWKLRVGGHWRDIPNDFCPWQTAFSRFNSWSQKGLWEGFFLSYEAKLIRSGYAPTEAMSALTSMQVELGLGKSEPLDTLVEDLLPRSTWPVMRMVIRSILKSLGVRYTMQTKPPKLFRR